MKDLEVSRTKIMGLINKPLPYTLQNASVFFFFWVDEKKNNQDGDAGKLMR